MSPTEKKYKKEFSHELLRIARADLMTAKAMAPLKGIRPENILYHVEQAVEKSIKAVLCFQEKAVPVTHDLFAILQRIDERDHPPGGYSLHDLTPFATVRRYQEGVDIISEEDITSALQAAEKVCDWAEGKLK